VNNICPYYTFYVLNSPIEERQSAMKNLKEAIGPYKEKESQDKKPFVKKYMGKQMVNLRDSGVYK
jgi:hypothetical protein